MYKKKLRNRKLKKRFNVKNKNDNIVSGNKTADNGLFKLKKGRPERICKGIAYGCPFRHITCKRSTVLTLLVYPAPKLVLKGLIAANNGKSLISVLEVSTPRGHNFILHPPLLAAGL